MCKVKNKLIKYIITGCIGLIFMLLISNINKVYAIAIGGSKNIEVYTTGTLYVSYETKDNNWSVYTKYNGKDSNENNVLKVWKHTYKNGHTGKTYADIQCKGKNAGTSRIYVKDGITGAVYYCDITITRRDITASSIGLSQVNYSYNGKAKTPRILYVNLNGTPIENYGYYYTNNVNAGTATVYVYGKGNNCGTAWRTFRILPRNISNANGCLTSSSFNLTYTGKRNVPTPFKAYIDNGATRLYYEQDFTYGLPWGDVKAERKVIRIYGIGNYCGSFDWYYTINPRDISSGKITFNRSEYEYFGGQHHPGIKSVVVNGISLGKNDFDIIGYGTNKKVGDWSNNWVKIKGKGNFKGTLTQHFTIVRNNISDENITIKYLKSSTVEYTGNANPPTPFEVYIDGRRLYYKEDFTYSLPNGGVEVGKQKLRINGIGSYSGNYDTYYTIKRDISNSGATVKYLNGNTVTYTGKTNPPTPFEVYIGGKRLYYEQDFTYSLPNGGIEAGTQKLRIHGTGNYYGYFDVYYVIKKSRVNELLAKASEIQEYIYKNKYTYGGNLTIDYKQSQTPGAYGYHHIVCATLVSWSLIESGIMDPLELQQESDNAHQASVSNFNHTGKFNEIHKSDLGRSFKSSDIKAGDVIIYGSDHHHVEIAADDGRNYVFNAGTDAAISGDNLKRITDKNSRINFAVESQSNISDIDVILRLK